MEQLQLSLDAPERRTVFSVSDLTSGLRDVVERAYGDVWVEGELSNFKRHRSGHCYFTLKDDNAQVSCVLWRHYTSYVFFEPQDGMLVRVHGSASVYEARGDLQIVAKSMQLSGEGALQKAFDDLKRKLGTEGLFEASRKKPIPAFPSAIGVVTSGSGAAFHDIVTVLRRRYPLAKVLLCPVQVQGMGAAEEIAAAVRCFNAQQADPDVKVDVLIVGRGGGSIEDLWAFNEEVVARAIAGSAIPVISAVGHETDYSIADLVADRRAATPSMAAEIAVPDQAELRTWLTGSSTSIASCLSRNLKRRRDVLESLLRSRAMHRPVDRLRQQTMRVDDLAARLERETVRAAERRIQAVKSLCRQLELLDPSRPLGRGYVRIERDGQLVTSASEIQADEVVELTFRDGSHQARVL